MILISNLTLSIKDGSTIASTEIYGVKTYVNIGSGNVFKLEWNTPEITNDIVDYYNLIIKRYDPTLNIYYDIINKNIGQVNEFYIDSPMLPAHTQYMLSIYLVAYGKYGSIITSNNITSYIIKGSGTYVKVKDSNSADAIMKRALGFVNVLQNTTSSATTVSLPSALTDIKGSILTDSDDKVLYQKQETTTTTELVLLDSDGNILIDIDGQMLGSMPSNQAIVELLDRRGEQFVDATGRSLFAPATNLLASTTGWTVVQEGYTKDANGTWHSNNIVYEALQVLNENNEYETLTDFVNRPIYIL